MEKTMKLGAEQSLQLIKYSGDQVEKNEMDAAYVSVGDEERCIQGGDT
jgi:hypothetical protein